MGLLPRGLLPLTSMSGLSTPTVHMVPSWACECARALHVGVRMCVCMLCVRVCVCVSVCVRERV